MFLAACGAQSNPNASPEDSSSAATTEPDMPPASDTGTATATASDTSTPATTASASAKASAAPQSLGHGGTEATNCTELAKKKCQVTRGCMWNEIKKCVKEETQ
jgi:hypothetical protein